MLLVCLGFATDKRPNVVTLLVDDLGYRDLGCYGGPVKTPVLDKLAAGGVRFTDFHSGAPSCSPSRATFLTGRHHYRAGVYSVITERLHKMHLLKSETTIAEVLKENGYATAHFGKWHLGIPVFNRENPTPGDHGFDYWFGLVNGPGPSHKNPTNFLRNGKRVGQIKGYSCQIVVDEALTWLDEKREADEPFFLNLWFNEPHAPIAAPDEIVYRYGALNDQASIYSGTIDNTDQAIGRLVARLEKLGELDNTIIVYASDNGSYRPERSGELRGQKGSQFEGGHRVPGIFYWKGGIPGGRVEDEPAGVVDLLPTLCGLIGIKKPAKVHLDGSDLAPMLTGSGKFKRHQPLFWMTGANLVLRMGDHTLFVSGTAKSPIDFKAANRLTEQIKQVLGDDLEKVLDGRDVKDLRNRLFNIERLANPEADRLKRQLRDLFYFNEAWIPELKRSELGRVQQLYDLSKDLGQQNNIVKNHPELVARMKKKAEAIYASVMADAPEWLTTEELAAAMKPRGNGPQRPTTVASGTDTAKLLARIDKNDLPKGYQGSRHQAYVDKVMAGLKPDQRARVGQLWKEKRRLGSDMPNPGASFVRILTHVAADAKKINVAK
ncbi:MAG: sulfatase-like hydrolase/transferase [Opitutae bacterium]|nr:sulfatase-like hydrolase/transferase [Opitutae bacterium]